MTVKGAAPRCPRCGYDLSVSTQLWPEDRCPTRETCTECGLDFRWSEVLHPELCPKWLVGHRLRRPVSWCRAMAVPLAPWKPMREAPLALPVRPVAELTVPTVLLGLWYTLMIVASRLEMWLFNPTPMPFWSRRGSAAGYTRPWNAPDWSESLFWPFHEFGMLDGSGLYANFTFIPVLLTIVLTPLMFLTLGTTLRRVKVRPTHLLRIATIGVIPVLTLAILQLVSRGALDALSYEGVITLPRWEWLNAYVYWEFSGYGYSSATWTWPFTCLMVFFGWHCVLWYSACRWYLRLPRPFLHACVLMFTSILASVTLMMALHRHFQQWLYHALMV